MLNKEINVSFAVTRRTVSLFLAALFIASSVHAEAVIGLSMIPISATPFDMKLQQSGFFQIQTNQIAAPSMSTLESIFLKARSFRYSPDLRGDRWQSPEETEVRRSGDCEDKAIWLYAELKKQGFSQVRLVIGKLRSFDNKCHVWVEIGDPNDALIVDAAAQKRVWKRSDFESGFYRPLYAFDGEKRLSFKKAS